MADRRAGPGRVRLLYLLAHFLKVTGVSDLGAVWFYWTSWSLATVTRIVILPIMLLTWIEDGGEFHRPRWTVPVRRDPLPAIVTGSATTGVDSPSLEREFSSLRELPEQVRAVPAPSSIRRAPQAVGSS